MSAFRTIIAKKIVSSLQYNKQYPAVSQRVLGGSFACNHGVKSYFATTTEAGNVFTNEAIQKANAKKESLVDIRKTPDGRGWGVFARQKINNQDLVMRGKALHTSDKRCSHSVQTDWNTHVIMDVPAILVNHSCNANVGIKGPNELGAYDFYALSDIDAGDEVLWDYETSESEITGFSCACGSSSCRGHLKGFASEHADILIEAYGSEHVAPYLLDEENEVSQMSK